MPAEDNQADWRGTVQLLLLLLALPAQFLIMNYSSVSQSQSQQALKDLIVQAKKVSSDLLSWPAWQKWCIGVIHTISNSHTVHKWYSDSPIRGNRGESPAVEVITHQDPEGHFANSPTIRSPRPKEVKFRVGEVINHKRWGYKGVIIGWDSRAKAPAEWLAANHPASMGRWRTQPNYAILVDTRDRKQSQLTYVPQENIELVQKTEVSHPSITDYFDAFDGTRYRARQALKELYPED